MPHVRGRKRGERLGLSLPKPQRGEFHLAQTNLDPALTSYRLAAPDKHSHIEMISALAELFSVRCRQENTSGKNSEDIKTIIDRF